VNTFHQHICTDYRAKITIFNDGSIITHAFQAGSVAEREGSGQVFNQAEFAECIYVCALHGAKLAQTAGAGLKKSDSGNLFFSEYVISPLQFNHTILVITCFF
jgi:hypothetical protein